MSKRFDTLNMHGANLRGQDLRGAVFDTCNLHSADFTGALLAGALFDTCNLHGATLPSSALSEARFDTCNMHSIRYAAPRFTASPPVATMKPEPPSWRSRPSQGAARPASSQTGEQGDDRS